MDTAKLDALQSGVGDTDAATAEAREAPASERGGAAPMTIYVCTTCREPQALASDVRPGARLHHALSAGNCDPTVTIEAVECLSVCRRPCTIAFAAPGKWTYVYGDLVQGGTPDATAVETILSGARLYAEAADGLIPWKLRPDALKKGVVARVPPLPSGRGA